MTTKQELALFAVTEFQLYLWFLQNLQWFWSVTCKCSGNQNNFQLAQDVWIFLKMELCSASMEKIMIMIITIKKKILKEMFSYFFFEIK